MFDGIGEGRILLADRAYDSDALRQSLADRGGACGGIKPMPNREAKPSFSPFPYRYRNLVEHFFSEIKHSRAVAKCSEKHAENRLALVKLAAIQIWLRFYQSVS